MQHVSTQPAAEQSAIQSRTRKALRMARLLRPRRRSIARHKRKCGGLDWFPEPRLFSPQQLVVPPLANPRRCRLYDPPSLRFGSSPKRMIGAAHP